MTESQLLILNNLIYRNEFTEDCDKTVEQILLKASANNTKTQQMMTPEEWEQVFEMARNDPEILKLKVTSVNYEPETGAKMACFVDPDGNATAVFAGTGANEWRDDCVAATMADSPQQQKALAWFESLPYDNITVSGHSKGGNKAMYVAVVSDKSGECYTFDGEGFSNEFCEKYADRIAQKQDHIHLRANSRDFVNVLLNYIAGDIKYVHNEDGINVAGEYHSPNALFEYKDGKPTGNIGALTDYQDPTMEMLHEFSVYLMNNATEAERILAFSVLGELMTQFLGGKNGIVREDILDMFGVEGLEIVLRYLSKYLRDLAISNPLVYLKYREAFSIFTVEAPENFWSYLIVAVGVATKGAASPEALFDMIASGTVERIYRFTEKFAGGNVRGRDFSQSVKERMLAAAKETEDEPWWRVDRWDCWYKVEKFFGGMQWDQYTGRVDAYYRKLIDMNDASVKDIEKIFTKVYSIDASYGTSVQSVMERLQSKVLSKINELADSVYPKVVVHQDYNIPVAAYKPVRPKKTNEPGHRAPEAYEEVMQAFDVANNGRYQPRNGATWCNIYVWDVTTAMGCEIPHYYNRYTGAPMTWDEAIKNPGRYNEMSAPRMTEWLENHGADYGWIECDEATAIAMANKGLPTVAAGTNTGHVAMVAPQRDGETGLMISQAGGRNFEHGPINQGFGRYQAKFFYHA